MTTPRRLRVGDRIVYIGNFYSNDLGVEIGEEGTVTHYREGIKNFSVRWDGGHIYTSHSYPHDFDNGYISNLRSFTWFDIWEPKKKETTE